MPKEETNPEKIKRLDKEIFEHFEKMNGHAAPEQKPAEAGENYTDQMKRLEKELSDQMNELNTEDREAFDKESRKFRQESDEA